MKGRTMEEMNERQGTARSSHGARLTRSSRLSLLSHGERATRLRSEAS